MAASGDKTAYAIVSDYCRHIDWVFGIPVHESVDNEEEEEERLLWQINNNTMLYMISFATETPIKTCNMSLAWEPPFNIMI